jgi:hypothetical protein
VSIEIKPFSEESSDLPVTSDARTTDFMDVLRARVAASDEKQQQKWVKATKPAAPRKPLTPARPEWLNQPKSPQSAAKATKTLQSRPFGSPKKKRVEQAGGN